MLCFLKFLDIVSCIESSVFLCLNYSPFSLIFSFIETELQERAFNLSLAALLGSEIYNFGELVSAFPVGDECVKSITKALKFRVKYFKVGNNVVSSLLR